MKKYTTIYEDDYLVIIDKPAGIPTVADRYDNDAPHLQGLLKRKYGEIYTVHRIDRDTSGVMVFAKDADTHRSLSMAFEERQVSKTYIAVVDGNTPLKGKIDSPIKESLKTPGYMTINKKGKHALTTYEKLEQLGIASYLKVDIHTGRTHQIRVHLKSIGHSLFVDPTYGKRSQFLLSEIKGRRYKKGKYEDERPLVNRLTLHAHTLSFTHPHTEKNVTYESPVPKDILALANQLRKVFGEK